MPQGQFDDALNEATHAAAGAWQEITGRRLDSDELYDLKDLLEGFFQDLED